MMNAEERTSQAWLPPVTGLGRRWVRHTPAFSWARPTNNTPSSSVNRVRNSWAMVVLALALGERHQLQTAGGDKAVNVSDERFGHRVHQRRGGVVVATVADEEALYPAAVGQ